MRPRNKPNRALPPNLYKSGKYFQYRHPQTKKYHGMGTDRAAAVQAANHLNAQLIEPISLVERILTPKLTFSKWLETYKTLLERRNFSESTARQRNWQIDTVESQFGPKPISQITTRDIAEFLDAKPARMSNVFRALLNDCFNEAIAKGHLTANPVAVTKNSRVVVQRNRLDMNHFLQIREVCIPVIQRAMDLALITLQRREDLAALRWEDTRNGVVQVVQHKTGTRLRITITPPLQRVLDDCETRIQSDWVLHHREDTQWFKRGDQLRVDYITRQFQRARDRLDLFPNMKPAERPTFHEIRSLGARTYEAAGMDAQALLGHKNRAMTEVYVDTRRNEWLTASPEIEILEDFGKVS